MSGFEQEIPHEDLSLVKRIRDGEIDLYAILVRQSHAKVHKLCLMLLSNASMADDAAEDALVKAYESLSRFKGKSSFSTWACHIAHNHCIDLLRKRSRQKTDSWEDLWERNPEKAESLLASSETDEGEQSKEKEALLHKTLAAIKPEHKEILILREIGSLSYEEIASKMKCSIDAVKARLQRARRELQEKSRHFRIDVASME